MSALLYHSNYYLEIQMKNIETFKLNRESIKEMLKSVGKWLAGNCTWGRKFGRREYHLSVKPDSFNVNELDSEDNWSEELTLKEGNAFTIFAAHVAKKVI